MDESDDGTSKDKTVPLTGRPFSGLKSLLDAARRDAGNNAGGPKEAQKAASRPSECPDDALFLAAVKDVTPLGNKDKDAAGGPPDETRERVFSRPTPNQQEAEKAEILEALSALVSGKTPFPVRQTPEFVEGPVTGSNEWLVTRLHQGEFSVQSYCDLHGLDVMGALDACEAFLDQALSEDKRCVAFIHGRGLSSPKEPVLKDAVTRWLAHGRHRRLVLAYSSAPDWDGGAGVTYVLLRRRPQKRKK